MVVGVNQCSGGDWDGENHPNAEGDQTECAHEHGKTKQSQDSPPLFGDDAATCFEGVPKIEFLIDEMNHDETFARVKVRKQLLPLMQTFNNRIVEALSRTAVLLGEDSALLFKSAGELLQLASETLEDEDSETKPPLLNVNLLVSAPPALRRRALRQWISEARGDARRLEMVHLLAVEALLEDGRGGRTAELPDGGKVTRKQGWLQLELEND